MDANRPAYDNLVEKDVEQEEESGEQAVVHPAVALLGACLPCFLFCCCCVFFFGIMHISAAIFAPPEPRDALGDVIWEPVLPQSFSTCARTFFWTSQEVHPNGTACEVAGLFSSGASDASTLGTWEPGWSFFSMYYYYEKPTANGMETLIHVQSVPRFFGAEFRMWRGDSADAPTLTIQQDYWAEPWFSWTKVRIFDVYQGSLHVARMTETVTPAWIGYGGATVDVFPPKAGELAGERPGMLTRMTQPGVFWLVFFEPPSWTVDNFAPGDIPSAVPGFYTLFSDICEQQQATGPIFWILLFLIICTNNGT